MWRLLLGTMGVIKEPCPRTQRSGHGRIRTEDRLIRSPTPLPNWPLRLPFLPSRAITSSRKWRLMISMILGVSRAKLTLFSYRMTGARFFHVACFTYIRDDYMYLQCRNFSLDTAIFTKPADFKAEGFTFGCVKLQNLAWPREIAKN